MFVGKDDPIGETHPSLSASRIRSSTKCAVPARRVLISRYRRYPKSSRVAIALSPHLLEIGPGDQVLVPTYHCHTMIAPVVQYGAEPMS